MRGLVRACRRARHVGRTRPGSPAPASPPRGAPAPSRRGRSAPRRAGRRRARLRHSGSGAFAPRFFVGCRLRGPSSGWVLRPRARCRQGVAVPRPGVPSVPRWPLSHSSSGQRSRLGGLGVAPLSLSPSPTTSHFGHPLPLLTPPLAASVRCSACGLAPAVCPRRLPHCSPSIHRGLFKYSAVARWPLSGHRIFETFPRGWNASAARPQIHTERAAYKSSSSSGYAQNGSFGVYGGCIPHAPSDV